MSDSDLEIVELIIDAKNLTSEELNKAASDIQALGADAKATEKELDKLKIKQATISSYTEVSASVKSLRGELAQAEVSYENLEKAVKSNKAATDDDRASVKLAKKELGDFKSVVKSQETELRKLTKQMKSHGVETKNTADAQSEIASKINELTAEYAEQISVYNKKATAHNKNVAAEREAIKLTEERNAELKQLIDTEEKALVISRKRAVDDSNQIAESKRVTVAISEYEDTLTRLNQEKSEGLVTNSQYITAESNLRKTLNLTESQVKTSRAAIQAAARDEVAAAKDIEKATAERVATTKKFNDERKKANEIRKQSLASEKALAAESKRVYSAVIQYEKELTKLNKEKADGVISTGKYIKSEADLRKNLKLTESQVKTSRAAIQADVKSKESAAKSTDALTTATRRLAQVYTVLLASQKAVEAVGSGVKEYGELEAAITKVEKTTGIARDQVEGLADQLLHLSNDVTPTTTNELLRFAEVAGQLGTKSTADILSLVSAADALELSTNLAGDEAVELLSRILIMTGEGVPAIHNLSSSVVALGNDFAVSEQDIVHMTKELISGTREINLGSAAAAAFGTVLKELGQPAERSRTAIQRLAGSIKEASLTGGDDLERLIDITGMTADEIEKNLGERPEAVLVAFLEGLNGISESGGIASDALRKMGIDGTEATSVLTVLAGGTERLKTALELSNEQYVKADGHFKEAVKSYANQDAAVGRLANKFTTLKTKIGEAFSDETNDAIKSLGDVLNDTEGDVVALMEYLPLMVDGLLDVADAINEITASLDGDEGIGAIGTTVELATLGVNALTITFKAMRVEINETINTVAQMYNAFQPLNEFKIDTSFLNDLQVGSAKLKASIAADNKDIQDSYDRLNGTSSLAFQGLVDAATKYGLAIETMDEKTKASIEAIVNQTGYTEGLDDTYRKLTASIVRASNEQIAETKLKEQAAVATKLHNEEKAKEVDTVNKSVEAHQRINVSLSEYNELSETVNTQRALSSQLLADGTIGLEEYIGLQLELNEALKGYTVISDEVVGAQDDYSLSIEEFTKRRDELTRANEAGLLTDRELVIAQQDLAIEFSSSANAINQYSSSMDSVSTEAANLNDQIFKSSNIVQELTDKIKNGNLALNEELTLKAKLAAEQEKLNDLKAEHTRVIELDNLTYSELILKQREYQLQLEQLNNSFESGRITKAEYEKEVAKLNKTLDELNGILGENTDEVDKNTTATKKSTNAKQSHANASTVSASAMSLEAQAAAALNQTYDKTNDSVESLNIRYRELQDKIVKNGRVSTGWMENLAKTWNAVFKQEQAVIEAEKSLRKWTAQIESGTLSLAELNKMAANADRYFSALSGNQLDGLIDSIDQARDKFNDLTDDINSSISDVDDRLDAALGNYEAITKRKFEGEVKELQALLDQANVSGNAQLVSKVETAITNLKKAQAIEFAEEFGNSSSTPTTTVSSNTESYTPSNTYSNQSSGESATLYLSVDGSTFTATMQKDIMNQLMYEIDKAKGVGY
ncbi:coil containing protein [Vibrio phage 2.096.O._10N.286.48.B5]|nr:coil containing protein [Vibrio phage 2.096.O._10N.286.48.B5]